MQDEPGKDFILHLPPSSRFALKPGLTDLRQTKEKFNDSAINKSAVCFETSRYV